MSVAEDKKQQVNACLAYVKQAWEIICDISHLSVSDDGQKMMYTDKDGGTHEVISGARPNYGMHYKDTQEVEHSILTTVKLYALFKQGELLIGKQKDEIAEDNAQGAKKMQLGSAEAKVFCSMHGTTEYNLYSMMNDEHTNDIIGIITNENDYFSNMVTAFSTDHFAAESAGGKGDPAEYYKEAANKLLGNDHELQIDALMKGVIGKYAKALKTVKDSGNDKDTVTVAHKLAFFVTVMSDLMVKATMAAKLARKLGHGEAIELKAHNEVKAEGLEAFGLNRAFYDSVEANAMLPDFKPSECDIYFIDEPLVTACKAPVQQQQIPLGSPLGGDNTGQQQPPVVDNNGTENPLTGRQQQQSLTTNAGGATIAGDEKKPPRAPMPRTSAFFFIIGGIAATATVVFGPLMGAGKIETNPLNIGIVATIAALSAVFIGIALTVWKAADVKLQKQNSQPPTVMADPNAQDQDQDQGQTVA